MTRYKNGRQFVTQGAEPETADEILTDIFQENAQGTRKRERELKHIALDEAMNGDHAERQGNEEEAKARRRASESSEKLAQEYRQASEVLEELAQKYYNVHTEAEQEQEANDGRQ